MVTSIVFYKDSLAPIKSFKLCGRFADQPLPLPPAGAYLYFLSSAYFSCLFKSGTLFSASFRCKAPDFLLIKLKFLSAVLSQSPHF